MRLRARVRRATGATTHRWTRVRGDGSLETRTVDPPLAVEIENGESGFFLLHFNAAGECVADSWHATLEEAKEQAKFEYEIEEGDWETREALKQ
jgi:hypothetical protein